MKKHINCQYEVSQDDTSLRLDQILSNQLPSCSRSQVQGWIKDGKVRVDDTVCLVPKTKLHLGQTIELVVDLEDQTCAQPEERELVVLYEDDDLLILDKPAGLVVHPGAGNHTGTLLNALLFRHPELIKLPRAGIVHRLDKDTTGVMMVAKSFDAYHALTAALSERNVKRQYLAVVDGQMKQGQSVDQPIGRHPRVRQKMAITPTGKSAISHVTLLERLNHYTLVSVELETGRTHQIRVHMTSLGHPLLGDPTYGKHRGYQKISPELAKLVLSFGRQALHAHHLRFIHPITKKTCHFEAPVPVDMQRLIEHLRINSP